MQNKNRSESKQLEKFWEWVDRLISFGFALGVMIIVALFVYVLITQFMGKS